MTARVTTLKGPDAGAYYVEALPDYYLDIDEPPGCWQGKAAARLGLSGVVDDEEFLSVMAGLHPTTGEHLGRRHGTESVRGFDLTASAPKAVSVLFALGDEAVRTAVVEAHDAAVAAVVDWIEDHAHTRYRVEGQVGVFDTEGIVAAVFRQHTSRALDPQLHSHVVIPNRVASNDGRWLSLDARTLKKDQQTLSALYHAGLRAELTKALGVGWREPVNGIAEMAGIDDEVLAEFSSRTAEVEERMADKTERFEESFDRAPTPRERWRLDREAVVDSRPAKVHGCDPAELHAGWAAQAADIGWDPEAIVAGALAPEVATRCLDSDLRHHVVDQALEELAAKQSAWRPAELVRELARAVPTDVAAAPSELAAWVEELAAETIAAHLVELAPPIQHAVERRKDGRPISESVLDRQLTTAAILAQEEELLLWAERRLGEQHRPAPLLGPTEVELTAPQRQLASAAAGHAPLVLAVGPAGTGKTTALAPAVAKLQSEGRPVFGVAPSAAAAEVLGTEAGLVCDTLDKLLLEHRLARAPGAMFDLPAGASVILDEAAMVSTPQMAELADLAERRRWRLVLVGDPLQFSAVGRGGMFGHLVETFGAIELDRVRRFAHPWERQASLALRRGDPSVVGDYEAHGRLHGGTQRHMEAAIVAAWNEARAGGETVAMMAGTNEAVARLNAAAQRLVAADGGLDTQGRQVKIGNQTIYVGDHVATRHNQRDLRSDRGLMVKNRDRFEVTAVGENGTLVVRGRTGKVVLPPDYVAKHVELAYAHTSHGAQGRTVDRALLLLDGAVDVRGIYVPMTRGRRSNEAFVVTDGTRSPAEVMAEALSRDWIDVPATARRAELHRQSGAEPQRRRPEPAQPALEARPDQPPRPELRRRELPSQPLAPAVARNLIEREHDLAQAVAQAESKLYGLSRDIADAEARRKILIGHLAETQLRLERAEAVVADLDRPLRRRRHRAELESARGSLRGCTDAIVADRGLLVQIEGRLPRLRAELAGAREEQSRATEMEDERHSIRAVLDADLAVRAGEAATDPFAQFDERLGSRPSDGSTARLWDQAAGRLAQHRAAFGESAFDPLTTRSLLEPAAEMTSRQGATTACEKLVRALGPEAGFEAPELDYGLSM